MNRIYNPATGWKEVPEIIRENLSPLPQPDMKAQNIKAKVAQFHTLFDEIYQEMDPDLKNPIFSALYQRIFQLRNLIHSRYGSHK